MFERKENRFITKGIDSDVPKEIQVVCWELIDKLVEEKVIEADYLQIFEFEKKTQDKKLIITHRQEKPTYQKCYEIELESSLLEFDISKLWVLDDGGVNQIMLLPEEY